jgi:hypothetical protein
MRGTSFGHLAFAGLLVLLALLQVTFHEKWIALAHSLNAMRWENSYPGDPSPQDRLRQYKISEKTRAAD